ncbi:MFS transporter [Niveibacterium sp. SC-1]|uniref:MFS transporter n=1 Tax=Niveibacterium sp. SC-1 TaxID=3135646 RepID=UPI00311E8234
MHAASLPVRPGLNARTRLGLIALGAAYFTLGVGSLAVIGLLDPMANRFGVARAAVAQLVTVFALSFALAAPLMQMVLGRVPRRRLLLLGLAVLAAGSLGTALAHGFAWVLACRVVMALGAALIGPTASALGASLVPAAAQGRALATVFAGMSVATVLGVPLAACVGHLADWRSVFVLLALLAGLCALGVATWVEEPEVRTAIDMRSFARVLGTPSSAWAVMVTLLQMAAQFASYALIAVLLRECFGTSAAYVSFALLVFGLGGIGGNTLAGLLGDRFGPEPLLRAAIGGLALVFLALAGLPLGRAGATVLLALWAVLGMVFQAPQQKRLISLMPQLRSLVLALNASALYLGMSLGAFLGAHSYAAFGARSLCVLSFALALLAGFAQWRSERAVSRT